MADLEALATIREITGADENRARQLLQSCDGNVEHAITLHFASDDLMALPVIDEPSVDQHAPWDADIGGLSHNITELPPSTLSSGVSTGTNGDVGAAVSSHSNAVPVAPEVRPYLQPSGFFGSLRRTFSAVSQAITGIASEDYQEWFLQNYGTPCPQFSTDNYSTTMEIARRDNKLVVLWLHKPITGTPEIDSCCRCFQHEGVLNAVNDNFLIFAGDASRFDAAHIAQKLNVRNFPTLVIVKPMASYFDDPFMLEWPFGVFAKPVGRITSANFSPDDVMLFLLQMVEEAQNTQQAQTTVNNARQLQNEEARLIREQQDIEYEEALLRDQLREIEAREQAERDASAPKAPASIPSPSVTQSPAKTPSPRASPSPTPPTPPPAKAETPKWKAARRNIAKNFLETELPIADRKKARISLRFPTGYRSDRTLPADAEAKILYAWAESIEEQMEISGEEHERCPRDVPEKISIWTSIPPQQIPNNTETLESLGLCPATALNVRFHKDSN
eukprot:GEMP01009911.1.p1 GENE.GEMP01009911.1~~GEMP01009911.1.p1  ORF type:complete len:504 (+),score=92.71 GEMP01009911.1:85-1596(+)